MATIGKITMAASGSAAIDYAYGKGRMPDETKSWLRDHGADPDAVDQLHDRAVVMDGWNCDPAYAKTQMAATRDAFKTGGKHPTRVIQSFSTDDLDPLNVADWQRANQIGMELAQKAFPDYQVGVYTQLDGVGHKLHNHLVVNEPNLITGQKYREHQSWQRISQLSDDICREHGLSVIDPEKSPAERHTMAERQLESQDAYVWKDDLRGRIDKAMLGSAVNSYESFSETLAASGVIIHKRGQSFSYEFLDAKNKHRRARGKTLGRDYESETIKHELERPETKPAVAVFTGPNRAVQDQDEDLERRKRETEQREQRLSEASRNPDSGQVLTWEPDSGFKETKSDFEQRELDAEQRKRPMESLKSAIQGAFANLQSLTEKAKRFIANRATSRAAQDFLKRFEHDQSVKKAETSTEPALHTAADDFLNRFNNDMKRKKERARQVNHDHSREQGGPEL